MCKYLSESQSVGEVSEKEKYANQGTELNSYLVRNCTQSEKSMPLQYLRILEFLATRFWNKIMKSSMEMLQYRKIVTSY